MRSSQWKNKVKVTDFQSVPLNPERLAYFQDYFKNYYYGEFRFGQGTENILSVLNEWGHGGEWLDLGAGPSTLLWSIPLNGIKGIACNDISVEALKVLDDFVQNDEVPPCYQEALKLFTKTDRHVLEMKMKVQNYLVFDAMSNWPAIEHIGKYDLITEFGTFGLAQTPEKFINCFGLLKSCLKPGGRVIGANWTRSAHLIGKEGHDNSYLHLKLIDHVAHRHSYEILHLEKVDIADDPYYNSVIVFALSH
ncbi:MULTISPECIES: methyltransferase domain-containing protein [Laceyella]|uniref:Methyltransferase family protein n=1 Tax=Laceyella sediminis TaxID=573074 RepID=A0ABX5EMV8_9BACL|nr:methyltransferase domain-containing protein [Laceyella sediminis]MRG29290.1 methyltransferase domain-containing protein [Laceyella tengchongensis]PRZ13619.1 methyltransferase family protein [Laceyella sediminis]